MERPKIFVTKDLGGWDPDPETGWREQSIAELGEDAFAEKIFRASQGDPFEPDATLESTRSDLTEMIAFVEDAYRPESWVVLSDERGEVGVLMPQMYPDDRGRGTLFYVGVFPERRGEGLGRRLHTDGLRRLRALGCDRYLGSTDVENAPMLAIFDANGCDRRPSGLIARTRP